MQTEYRIKSLQEKMREHKLPAALLFYSRDVFYYTGTSQPAYLAVLPQEYFLFVKSGFEFARRESFLPRERIKAERRLENIFRELSSQLASSRTIGTELDILTVEALNKFNLIFSGYEFTNISPLILDQRKTKDATEIESIKGRLRRGRHGPPSGSGDLTKRLY